MRPPLRLALLALTSALVLGLALAVALGGFSGTSRDGSPPTSPSVSGFDGAVLPQSEHARAFTLTDQSGRRVSLSSYGGQVVVLAFLYSTCGPSCTVIAQQIRGALDELGHPVPVLIVSADPAADTPARVRRFLAQASLTGRVHYLTGPISALRPAWHAYGAVPASAGRSAFERSASVFLVDSQGRLRIVFPVEQLTPEALAHDIGRLQSGS
ncbi:MAG TPA: SCO family protein [Solirubrobacteraceae bacterium]|nr:SCO family protein [Solirubrobacteraceae bacterium]